MVAAQTPPQELAPPLEPGDKLTRAEFQRRYEASPSIKRAELVEGVVYVASPVRLDYHGRPHAIAMAWLTAYWTKHPDLDMGDNTTVRLDLDNEFQPDAVLRRPDGGTSTQDESGFIDGPPEFVLEIAASSASHDVNQKLQVYRRAGVMEYFVWRVFDGAIDWFELRDGVYERIPPGDDGVIESRVFPGLRLNPAQLIAGDLAAVVAGLR